MKLITYQCPLTCVSRVDAEAVYNKLKSKWPFGDEVSDEHITYALIYALNMLYDERVCIELSPAEWGEFVSTLLVSDLYRRAVESAAVPLDGDTP